MKTINGVTYLDSADGISIPDGQDRIKNMLKNDRELEWKFGNHL